MKLKPENRFFAQVKRTFPKGAQKLEPSMKIQGLGGYKFAFFLARACLAHLFVKKKACCRAFPPAITKIGVDLGENGPIKVWTETVGPHDDYSSSGDDDQAMMIIRRL